MIVVQDQNKPGILSSISESLGNRGVNILGFDANVNDSNTGEIHLLVDQPGVAQTILQDRAFVVRREEVVVTEVPNQPGILGRVTEPLRKNNINIEYAFSTSKQENSDRVQVVLRTQANNQARTLLENRTVEISRVL